MVMSLIESLTRIKNAVYGREVREAIHDGVFRANQIADGADTKADNTQLRQDAVEDFNAQVIQEMTDKDVISAPEIIQSRKGEANLNARLDKDKNELSSQLAQTNDILLDTRHRVGFKAVNIGLEPYNVITGDNVDSSLQMAIDDVYNEGGGTVEVPDGVYFLSATVKLKDNVKLKLSDKATIKMDVDANIPLFINDPVHGTKKIEVEGGIFDGSASDSPLPNTQDPKYGALRLRDVEELIVNNIEIKETRGWGIAGFGCSNFHIKDIKIDQEVGDGVNGDGVTMMGGSGTIENITGYTNDDLVAISAGNNMSAPLYDVGNVTIRNITALEKEGEFCHRPVAVYATRGKRIKNIIIQDVKGVSRFDIYIANFHKESGLYPEDAYIDNLIIRDVQVNYSNESTGLPEATMHRGGINLTSINVGSFILDGFSLNLKRDTRFLTIKNSKIENMILGNGMVGNIYNRSSAMEFDNETEIDTLSLNVLNLSFLQYAQVGLINYGKINTFNIDVVSLNYKTTAGAPFILDYGTIKEITFNNVKIYDTTINANTLYRKQTTSQVKTNVSVHGSSDDGNGYYLVENREGVMGLNGIGCFIRELNSLTPNNGDIVKTPTSVFAYYNGWVDLLA